MRIVVFGAQGGVGRHAVEVAGEQGHDVVAAARRHTEVTGTSAAEHTGKGVLEQRVVDVRDVTAVHDALEGADAVLWCVGVTRTSGGDVGRTALPHVVRMAGSHGVKRLVSVSGAGVTLPEDAKGRGAQFVSALTRRFAHDLVVDKEGEHAVLAASDLAWTEVRPPRLSDSAGTGRWRLDAHAPGLSAPAVAKRDVARCLVDLSCGHEWVGASPFLHARKA